MDKYQMNEIDEYFKKLMESTEKATISIKVADKEYTCLFTVSDLVSGNGPKQTILHLIRQVIPI